MFSHLHTDYSSFPSSSVHAYTREKIHYVMICTLTILKLKDLPHLRLACSTVLQGGRLRSFRVIYYIDDIFSAVTVSYVDEVCYDIISFIISYHVIC